MCFLHKTFQTMQLTKIMIVLVLGALLKKNRYITCILRISVYVRVTLTHVDSFACQPFMPHVDEGAKEVVFLGNCWPFDEVKVSYQMCFLSCIRH